MSDFKFSTVSVETDLITPLYIRFLIGLSLFYIDTKQKKKVKTDETGCLRHRNSKTAFCDKCNKTIKLPEIGEQTLESHIISKKHLKNMKPIYRLFQPRKQSVKNTTEQLTTEPSGSTPPVHQKQLKLVLNSSSAEKRKTKIF